MSLDELRATLIALPCRNASQTVQLQQRRSFSLGTAYPLLVTATPGTYDRLCSPLQSCSSLGKPVSLVPDSVPAKSGRHTTVELRGKPFAPGAYVSERLSHGELGKIAQG